MGGNDGCTPQGFFAGSPACLALFTAVQNAGAAIGEAEIRVTKSQIAFRRRKGFAYVWRPGQYVKSEVPAVLSIALPDKVASNRFKEVAHPAAKLWMHHLELSDPLRSTPRSTPGWPRPTTTRPERPPAYSCMSTKRE